MHKTSTAISNSGNDVVSYRESMMRMAENGIESVGWMPSCFSIVPEMLLPALQE